jgi:DNA-binding response OmpR family regulator
LTAAAADHVVVVDDDEDVRALVRRKLEQASLQVSTAADGVAGLELIRATRPALVLLDVMMPGLDGLAVLRAVRADPELRGTPAILLTARTMAADVERGFAAGADDYIVKPFSPRELLSRARAVLDRGRSSR